MNKDMFSKCYLDYVGLGDFNPNNFSNPEFKNDITYNDPDSDSEELYLDLIKLYMEKFKKLGFDLKYNNYDILMISKNRIFSMSSDYIGPSRASARNVGIDPKEVGHYLKSTRILGGHIIFPKTLWGNGKIVYTGRGRTINTSRGGAKGFNDRIDCTLFDIKKFYEKDESCKLFLTYKKYEEWLRLFNNFSGFIDFFCLNDFCNENYNVYDLSTFNSYGNYVEIIGENYKESSFYKITDKMKYISFINGSKKAIELRNLSLKKQRIAMRQYCRL